MALMGALDKRWRYSPREQEQEDKKSGRRLNKSKVKRALKEGREKVMPRAQWQWGWGRGAMWGGVIWTTLAYKQLFSNCYDELITRQP